MAKSKSVKRATRSLSRIQEASLDLRSSYSDAELQDFSNPNIENFPKFSFLVRRSDLSTPSLPCIWSIENHILIVKWVPTEVPGQFQITNRYNLWNGFETHRYEHLHVCNSEICRARDTGFVTLDPETMDKLQEYFE